MRVQVRVFYFAAVRDLVGQGEEVVALPNAATTAGDFVAGLMRNHPRLVLDGVRIAINEEFVELSHPLADGDTLALIPPVSGG